MNFQPPAKGPLSPRLQLVSTRIAADEIKPQHRVMKHQQLMVEIVLVRDQVSPSQRHPPTPGFY